MNPMKLLRLLALSLLAACVARAQPTPPTPDTSTLTTNGSNQIQQSFIVGGGKSITVNGGALALGYTTTATAAGTTTLTAASNPLQYFTGSTTQTVVMPVTSTLLQGQSFTVVNNSTGAVTVQSSGANSITVLAGGTSATFTCILTSGTTAASWQALPAAVVVASGKVLKANNSLTLAGTDGTTETFPATSASIARTDAGQTFTGTQTFSSAPVFSSISNTGTLTLPTSTDTLIGRATADTLTNKIFDTASNTFNFNGAMISGGASSVGTFGSMLPIQLRSKSITILTAATPADLGFITLPAGITRWFMANSQPTIAIVAETASGTLAAGTLQFWTAAGGTGTQLTTSLSPPASAGGITSNSTGENASLSSSTTIYIRQVGTSANAGTISVYMTIWAAL